MDSLFEYRDCPCCGQNDSDVAFKSVMKPDDFDVLLDYSMEEYDSQEWGRYVKCRNCHLIYMNPLETINKTNEYYRKAKNTHAPIVRDSCLRTAQSQLRLIQKHAGGTDLLDIGCAQGFFLFNACKAGYAAKGVEISQDAVAYARNEFGLDVEAQSFGELRFGAARFDVVTLWQVLEHVPYPLMMLREVNRILKPGGLVVVSTPNIGGIPARILRKKWWDIKRLHINQFATKTLTHVLRNAGFRNISPVSFRGFVSLSILLTMMVRYLGVYERVKSLLNPDSISGKIMNKIVVVYSSRLNFTTVVGFK
jgi:2-polyprenyl-3-methyl-5-hydroxy-6-metoxy-1,4-benzoquinol methylase